MIAEQDREMLSHAARPEAIKLLTCPACGVANAPDVIFCANTACHKALGEFRYAKEELRAQAHWHERLAERVTEFVGRPHYFAVHSVWFFLWITVNTGMIAFTHQFDAYPFGLLGIILSIEAIFVTGFVLINQNRQSALADKRAELDYEVNVRTFREVQMLNTQLRKVLHRLEALEANQSNTQRRGQNNG